MSSRVSIFFIVKNESCCLNVKIQSKSTSIELKTRAGTKANLYLESYLRSK